MRIWVVVDAVIVLCGGVLTGMVFSPHRLPFVTEINRYIERL